MNALDTNGLVRFLVNDDEEQAQSVRKVLLDQEKQGASVFISTLVLLETIWVLGSAYKFSKTDILHAINSLLLLPVFSIEAHDRVADLCRIARHSTADLADILIGLTSRDFGCATTLTFDKQAAKSSLFSLLE
jgi:predicted nucleic-acid-binding protein